MLREIIEKKGEQINFTMRKKEKGIESAWLEKMAKDTERQEKEAVVMSHASFAFSYLGLLHLENLFFKLQNSKIDMNGNFDNEYQRSILE